MECNGPVALRYPKGGDGIYQGSVWTDIVSVNSCITIATYGTMINEVLNAAEMLKASGIIADIIKLDQIQPLNMNSVAGSVIKTDRLIFVEETASSGSVGEAVLAELMHMGMHPTAALMNLGDGIVPHGDLKSLRTVANIDANAIYERAKELMGHEK